MTEYINKSRAIQAIANCTTMRDRQQIEDLCRRSENEAHGWTGGLRDAMSALDEVQPEVWPLCVEAREITEDDFAGADDHGRIPAWVVIPDDIYGRGSWSGWTLITKKSLLDSYHYFTCRPTVKQIEQLA